MDRPRLLCIAAVVVLHGAAVTWWWQRRSSWRDAAAARPRLGAAARAECNPRARVGRLPADTPSRICRGADRPVEIDAPAVRITQDMPFNANTKEKHITVAPRAALTS